LIKASNSKIASTHSFWNIRECCSQNDANDTLEQRQANLNYSHHRLYNLHWIRMKNVQIIFLQSYVTFCSHL